MSQQLRRNKIQILLSPNNYYSQLPKAQRDVGKLTQITIAPMQIKKVEIYKSYLQHVTDVVVEIDNLDPDVATFWAEGKYIANLIISPESSDNPNNIHNYFVCYDMKRKDVPPEARVYGSIPTISATVILKSITRTRLEVENNFTYELGGKNGKGAAGVGKHPLEFLHTDLMEIYNRNYLEEGLEATKPWNTDYCDLIEPIHQIHTTPSNGYKMIVDNNIDTLEFFFRHYHLFNTPYDWILDDCSTGGYEVSSLRISDFAWWPAWEPFIDQELSKILNVEPGSDAADRAFNTASAIRFFKIQKVEHVAYYDWFVFYVRNGYPKIWAVDVSSGKPIPMNNWNAVHEDAKVMTPSGAIKTVKNPMYKEYLTFMTPKEIEEAQQYLNIYQGLHPLLEKYSFSNVFVGDVDIHTIIELKMRAGDDTQKFDRLGMGYQVLHTYSREDLQPKGMTETTSSGNDQDPVESKFSYSHALRTEIVFLTIDKGDLNITGLGTEDAINVQDISAGYVPPATDECASQTDQPGVGVVPGGSSGTGIPNNSSIADQGEAIVSKGFVYCYGCTAERKMDCSSFTQKAVTRSGIGGYPRTTSTQLVWCQKYAQRIDSYENIQRGDIIFWKTYTNRGGHTGIATSNSHYAHANSAKSARKGTISAFSNYRRRSKTDIFRLKGGA